MQLRTGTAFISAESIQDAYNRAVLLDREALAHEIAVLWLRSLPINTAQCFYTEFHDTGVAAA